jgi:hypothetical protein
MPGLPRRNAVLKPSEKYTVMQGIDFAILFAKNLKQLTIV